MPGHEAYGEMMGDVQLVARMTSMLNLPRVFAGVMLRQRELFRTTEDACHATEVSTRPRIDDISEVVRRIQHIRPADPFCRPKIQVLPHV